MGASGLFWENFLFKIHGFTFFYGRLNLKTANLFDNIIFIYEIGYQIKLNSSHL